MPTIQVSKIYSQGIPGAAQPVGLYSSFSVNTPGFTIPAGVTGVTVPMYDAAYLSNGGSLPVVISGIPGTLSRSGSTYTFTRFAAGSSLVIAQNIVAHALGVATFVDFASRPTGLTTAEAGRTFINDRTGNFHRWTGSAWVVLGRDERVNVLDYGAVGNGVADDYAAIAAAIALGEETYFPAGTYLISAPIAIIASNVTLVGVPGRSLIVGATGQDVLTLTGVRITTGTLTAKIATYLNNIVIDGLSFQSRHVFDGNRKLIQARYVKNSVIRNCQFFNKTYGAGTNSVLHCCDVGGFFNFSILNNTFFGTGVTTDHTSCYGFSGLNDSSISENGYSSGNTCIDSNDTGLGCWTGVKNITISGDTFYPAAVAYTGVAIDLAGATGVQISDCKIVGGVVGIRVGTNLGYVDQDISINDCLLYDQTDRAIMIYHENFSVAINGGTIRNTAGTGIYVGLLNAWTGTLQILNTTINCTVTAINFDLIVGNTLKLNTSNPNIIAGNILGLLDETRVLGDTFLGDLVHTQTADVVCGTTDTLITTVRLGIGFYRVTGRFTLSGSYMNFKTVYNAGLTQLQLTGTTFDKYYLVKTPGNVSFVCSVPVGGTAATLKAFNVHRVC